MAVLRSLTERPPTSRRPMTVCRNGFPRMAFASTIANTHAITASPMRTSAIHARRGSTRHMIDFIVGALRGSLQEVCANRFRWCNDTHRCAYEADACG